MVSRRQFVIGSTLASSFPFIFAAPFASGENIPMPTALADTQAKFYNFLETIIKARGLFDTQKIVMNNTIVPFDIAADTPYYNEELYRLYSDRTFSGAVGELVADKRGSFQPARYSNQYQALVREAASKIDQNHPEIQKKIKPLMDEIDKERKALNKKIAEFAEEWSKVAASRGLDLTSKDPAVQTEINLQRITWLNQARYREALKGFTQNIDSHNAKIDAIRRSKYNQTEQAILNNMNALTDSYYLARPWNASTERTCRASGTPLSDAFLADPDHVPPNLFDISSQIIPIGDLGAFLAASGSRSFSSTDNLSTTTTANSNWGGGGGGGVSIFGVTIGGGGGASGSSSFTKTVSTMAGYTVAFQNIAEYYADRNAWFDPAVLQDPVFQKMVKGRPELSNLKYIAVSLIVARGLNMQLTFAQAVNKNEWSNQGIDAQGGISFLGFSFGGHGSSSSTTTTVEVNNSGTVVTFTDSPNVCRVLGVRVEQILPDNVQAVATRRDRLSRLTEVDSTLQSTLKDFTEGKASYVDLQKARIEAAKKVK